MKFRRLNCRQIAVAPGVVVTIDYEGEASTRAADLVDKVVVPLLVAAPTMAKALKRIADGDHAGAYDPIFGQPHEAVSAIGYIKEAALRALPEGLRNGNLDV